MYAERVHNSPSSTGRNVPPMYHPPPPSIPHTAGDRVSEFSVKQMDLNAETLGIPDAEYDASVTMPANQFQRIVRDLTTFGEGLAVSVVKDAIKFHTTGDHGTANITCKQSSNVDGVCGWGIWVG